MLGDLGARGRGAPATGGRWPRRVRSGSPPSWSAWPPGGRSGTTRTRRELGPRVRGVPVLAAAAWAMMARPAWVVAGRLTRAARPRVACAAGALTAWDVFLDPRMAREGYWTWPGGGRYEGVPASNFAGWFLTGLARLRRVRGARRRRRRGDEAPRALRLDLAGRDVRQRRALGAAAGRASPAARRWARSRSRRCGGPMRVAVVGAGVGGLAAAIELAAAGHRVTVFEQAAAPGGKCARVRARRVHVGRRAVAADDAVGVRRSRARARCGWSPSPATASPTAASVELSADLPRALEALEAWSPGRGRRLGALPRHLRGHVGARRSASSPAPRRGRRAGAPGDPRDALRVKPWWTLRQLARARTRATRGCGWSSSASRPTRARDPRRAPAALAVAGYVEHAFGAWHPRGGLYELVRRSVRRLEALGGELRLGERVERDRVARGPGSRRGRGRGRRSRPTPWSPTSTTPRSRGCSAGRRGRASTRSPGSRCCSACAAQTPGLAHHRIGFPADYDAEFDDVFVHRRPSATRRSTSAPRRPPSRRAGDLVRARQRARGGPRDWAAEAERADRPARRARPDRRARVAHARRSRARDGRGRRRDLRRGAARPARRAQRPGNRVRGVRGLWLAGGTVHPGGGLPLVALGGRTVARQVHARDERVAPVPGARRRRTARSARTAPRAYQSSARVRRMTSRCAGRR